MEKICYSKLSSKVIDVNENTEVKTEVNKTEESPPESQRKEAPQEEAPITLPTKKGELWKLFSKFQKKLFQKVFKKMKIKFFRKPRTGRCADNRLCFTVSANSRRHPRVYSFRRGKSANLIRVRHCARTNKTKQALTQETITNNECQTKRKV